MKPITKEWLKAANDDIMVIEKIISEYELTHIVAFHAQQCVEKSLKALFEERGIELFKIHKLKLLFKQLSDIAYEEKIVELLDKLYIESRYPGDLGLLPNGKPTLEDAKEFYDFAKSIYLQISELTNK